MATVVGPQGFLRQQAAATTRADSRDLLAGIACPTFVVHGAEDRLIPVAAGEELAASIPAATLRLVDQAGHCIFLERPDTAVDIVDEFLSTIPPDRHTP